MKPTKEQLITIILSQRYAILIAICIIGYITYNVTREPVDPIDNHTDKMREMVRILDVVDSTYNGFTLAYATVNAVTKERFHEIRRRPHIQGSFKRLQDDAPIHFGSMLETDIYDFADFALEYDCDDDVRIHNIMIAGNEKCNLYIGPNGVMENWARWINHNTHQGKQWINSNDIYFRARKNKVYRYWKCRSPQDISLNDERFSHFSEDQRIW